MFTDSMLTKLTPLTNILTYVYLESALEIN